MGVNVKLSTICSVVSQAGGMTRRLRRSIADCVFIRAHLLVTQEPPEGGQKKEGEVGEEGCRKDGVGGHL